ncbi:MAG: hypothetical protein CM15mP23_07300 [Cryomorphaceae bacterium]|nr:MAG: hypothetical protein CM15mP23_07300 [Cryomorphaceae bacterium]
MRFKRILLSTIMLFSFQIIAQEEAERLKYGLDKELCEQNLSIYIEFYKQKNYKDAYKPWSYLFNNAPKRTKNIYLHGPKIIKDLIKNLDDQSRLTPLIDSLIMVYDQRNVYYKGKEAYVIGMKGADMYKYKKTTTEGLQASYEELRKAFEMAGNESTASVLNYYFMATTKLVQAKVLQVEDLIALFSDLSGVISYKEAKLSQDIYNAEQIEELSVKEQKLLKKNKKELKTLGDVKTNLEKTLAPHATCEKLIELYAKNFEQNKDDVGWMKRAAKLLNKKECTDSDIFFSISEALYNIDPSSSAAANMGIRSLKRKDFEKAEVFYIYALENEPDEINKAQYAFRLAQTYGAMNKNNSAKTYALKAAAFRSGWGEPYLLIGDLYAKTSRQCGELKTEFLKRVGYWAAIDKYEYAKRIDPQLSTKSNERIEKYTKQMPSKTDIFTEGLIDEATYKIDCWYSETVKIRVP